MPREKSSPPPGRPVLPARLPDGATDALAVLALAGLARLLYGAGAIGYDAAWALVWGRELAAGTVPQMELRFAPTPHPLANAVSAPLSWLGDAAPAAVMALSFVAFGALVWFAFRLGTALLGAAVGAVFALVLFTRPSLVNETSQALVDIPFLALVAAAGTVALREEPRATRVLTLLALAGLLRPEAWGLALLYALYAWRRAGTLQPAVAGLAVAGPVIWALADLLVTGDPLHSLHGTQALAAELDRPRDLATAAEGAPRYLSGIVGGVVGGGGLIGVALALLVFYERALAPAAVAGLGLIGFLVLGAFGLPVLTRYLLVPAVVLGLFFAILVAGWTALARDSTHRTPWMAAGVLAAIAFLVSLSSTVAELRDGRAFLEQRRAAQADLRALTRAAPARATIARCERLAAPEYQPVPLLAVWLDRAPRTIDVRPATDAPGTAFVSYATPEVARLVSLVPREIPPPVSLPAEMRRYANDSWTLDARC